MAFIQGRQKQVCAYALYLKHNTAWGNFQVK